MKSNIKKLALLSLGIIMFLGIKNINAQETIKSVKIGEQTWMAENLNVDRFKNGDLIPEVKSNEEWISVGNEKKPAWCYFENNSENGKKYGKLYNLYAVNEPRGLCPKGWHVPTKEEFEYLIDNETGNALKAIGEGAGRGVGINTSGFRALLAGYRYGKKERFSLLNSTARFWSSSNEIRCLLLRGDDHDAALINCDGIDGNSVRCIED